MTDVRELARAFRASVPTDDPVEFLRARFDAGLAWVHYPAGLGGLGLPREQQAIVDEELAGTPSNDPRRIGIGLGMAAPTVLRHGTPEQRRRFLRPLWTGEELWCQLFSEPGAGSDLAGLATRAVRDGDGWRVTGQKVWTSMAHRARWAILLARTDPDLPKHRGLTYFVCDMTAPGVDVRPLRQLTGEAEFNEVFLTDVFLPDDLRLGAVGEGWAVARTTLMNERVSIGGGSLPRGGGLIGMLTSLWTDRPDVRTAAAHDEMMRLWVAAEAARLTGVRARQQLAAGDPGPEGSAVKLAFAELAQRITGLELELRGAEGLRHDDWTMRHGEAVDFEGRSPTYRWLRAKGTSIEGGTSEILRNIIAERVLGLPAEPRTDTTVPWRELPR
ncbi:MULTISPECIES: acyl-CoA dehydrogenase family protein [Catenuloplanes]|uniref:Alkylation response protein AidB-like acyl-CoA dehydrogenase n=1 Tax=Catenuloplanes niger TaxID=587534 RepID=A0AAE4CWF1_9ACTN|nr:acyl-CoA dehydrogenase family protein [Catenuloplanes niger]MDR7326427.1 alkylation response protein AidB-like acyl-CoA dehydrogenase [Catenuloplanes niger]